jgi:septum formation protein
MDKLILASSSPRRWEVLKKTGIEFEVLTADIDETPHSWEKPGELAERLALGKAVKVYEVTGKHRSVIGADTVVATDEILNKPYDEEDAFRMLKMLSGRDHRVITGVAVINGATGEIRNFSEVTWVSFADLTDEEITGYIRTGEPMDKAGAYAIQGRGGLFVKSINGCFYNVMGFPLYRIYSVLKEMHIIR